MDAITRRKWARRALCGAAALVVPGAGLVIASSAWIERASATRIVRRVADAPARTVAIVLGARVYPDGSPSPMLEDRLETARALYIAGKVRRILVSGDHGTRGYDEVNGMHRWLVRHGVPERDVFLDHAGLRTLDTMARAAKVFGVRDAIVCTQEFHLARAVFLARHAGIDAVGIVSDRRRYGTEGASRFRELFARSRAVLDVHVLGTEPRSLGEPIPIDGDARATHDTATERRGG